jgi:hypothetical protein
VLAVNGNPVATNLSLAAANISDIPNAYFSFTEVTHLNLSFNTLSRVPSLEGFPQLVYLDLSHNALSSWPFHSLQACPKITNIDISHQRPYGGWKQELPVINKDQIRRELWPVLKEIRASHTLLEVFPVSLLSLPSLQVLDVRSAGIQNLPAELARQNYDQRGIWLSGNPISVIDWSQQALERLPGELVVQLAELRALNLAQNALHEVPSELSRLPNLYWLDLSTNYIYDKASLSSLSHLKFLDIATHPYYRQPVKTETYFKIMESLDDLECFIVSWALNETHMLDNALVGRMIERSSKLTQVAQSPAEPNAIFLFDSSSHLADACESRADDYHYAHPYELCVGEWGPWTTCPDHVGASPCRWRTFRVDVASRDHQMTCEARHGQIQYDNTTELDSNDPPP